MMEYNIEGETLLETSHAKYFQMNMEILTIINPILTEIYKILQSHISTVGMIEEFDEKEDYSFFLQIYEELSETMIRHCPVPLILFLYCEEYTPQDSQTIIYYIEQEKIENKIYESKELFKKLTSLLKKSINLQKTIKIIVT